MLGPKYEKVSPLPYLRDPCGRRTIPQGKQAVPAIVPTLVVAYCLHLPLVEVHVTTSCLVLIAQLRVHATYLSLSYTAMKYAIMAAVLVVVEVPRLRYGLVCSWV